MANETVGAIVRRLRVDRGLKQVEVADRARIPRASLAAIETDRIDKPSIDKLERIAAVLEIDPHILMKAAGYRVGTPPPIKEKTIGERMLELARAIREDEKKAAEGDREAHIRYREAVAAIHHSFALG